MPNYEGSHVMPEAMSAKYRVCTDLANSIKVHGTCRAWGVRCGWVGKLELSKIGCDSGWNSVGMTVNWVKHTLLTVICSVEYIFAANALLNSSGCVHG